MNRKVKKKCMAWCLAASMTMGATLSGEKGNYVKANEVGTSIDDIGINYADSGEGDFSTSGVRISVNGRDVTYCFENWKKYTGYWNCYSWCMDGQHSKKESEYMKLADVGTSNGRCIVFGNKIKSLLNTDKYIICRTCYQYGKVCSKDIEYSWKNSSISNENSLLYAMENAKNLSVTQNAYYSKSYVYEIYDVTELGIDATIPVHIGNSVMLENGIATYNGFFYNVKTFPCLKYSRKGYSGEFVGWYTSENSTKDIKEGAEMNPGGELYARWKEIKNKYNVRCIDVMEDDPTGDELGRKDWAADYDTVIQGSDIGDNEENDAYYSGVRYVGCSTATVTTSGCTVYRYFAPNHYNVTSKDVVSEGKNQGMILGGENWKEKEGVSVSAEKFGTDTGEGVYYPGYSFVTATKGKVTKAGCEIERKFAPIKYNIVFDGNGGTSGSMKDMTSCNYGEEYVLTPNNYVKTLNVTVDLNRGKDISEDVMPITRNSEFNGWSETLNGEVVYENGETIKNLCENTGTKKLYASWYSGDKLIGMTPSRKGYIFAGWAETKDATEANDKLELQDGMTVYAVWKPDVSKYKVTYYKQKEDGSDEMISERTEESVTGREVTADLLSELPAGYHVDLEKSKVTGTVSGEEELNLTVYYAKNDYKVIFDECDGEWDVQNKTLKGQFEEGVKIPETEPTRKGYHFIGWKDIGSDIKIYHSGDTVTFHNQDITLQAVWEPITYTISYHWNKPEGTKGEVKGTIKEERATFEEKKLVTGSSVSLEGYEFVGWNTSSNMSEGKLYAVGEEMKALSEKQDQKVDLYAAWKPIMGDVEYDKNLPTGIKETEEAMFEKLSFCYDRKNKITEQVYTLPGYEMIGWSKTPNGTVEYQPGEDLGNAFTKPGHYKLYAIWKESSHVAYTVIPLYEKIQLGEYEKGSEITLYGTTGETVEQAMKLEGNKSVFHGFSLSEKNDLTAKISGDGTTKVSVKFQRNSYDLKMLAASEDGKSVSYEKKYVYGEGIVLPKEWNGIKDIVRYRDDNGKSFMAGESYVITDNVTLIPQHKVDVYFCNGKETGVEYADHGSSFLLPKSENGRMVFDGWYYDAKYAVSAGKNGERITYLSSNCSLYAKWKEPEHYEITYNTSGCGNVVILNGKINSYQTGDRVILPDASQVVVDKGTHFVGWYLQGDSNKNIITEIPQNQSGKVVLCLKVEKDKVDEKDTGIIKNPTSGNGGSSGGTVTQPSGNGGSSGGTVTQPSGNGGSGGGAATQPSGNGGSSGGTATQPSGNGGNSGGTVTQPSGNGENSGGTTTQPSGNGESSVGNVTQPSGNDNSNNEGKPSGKDDVIIQNDNGEISVKDSKDSKDKVIKKEKEKTAYLKVGSTITQKGIKYKVLSAKKGNCKLKVMGEKSTMGEVVIPKSCLVNGVAYDVTEIATGAFQKQTMKKVTISDSVKIIGKKAFYKCKNLKICKLGSKIIKIGSKAFYGLGNKCKIYGKKQQEQLVKKSGISKTTKFVKK